MNAEHLSRLALSRCSALSNLPQKPADSFQARSQSGRQEGEARTSGVGESRCTTSWQPPPDPPRSPRLGERLGPTTHHFPHAHSSGRCLSALTPCSPQRLITRASRRTLFSFLQGFQPSLLKVPFPRSSRGLFIFPAFVLTNVQIGRAHV